MNTKADKFADALRLLKLMPQDGPLLEKACLSLGIDAFEFEQLKAQPSKQKKTTYVAPTSAKIEAAVEPAKVDIPSTLPKLSNDEKWQFVITFLADYQKISTNNNHLMDNINKEQPHQLTKSTRTSHSTNLPRVNNTRVFWQKLLKGLGHTYFNNQLDEPKLINGVAQKKTLLPLPFKPKLRLDKTTWLYIDQSENNYPLYGDFNDFVEQLYRLLGQNTVDKVIEVTDFNGPCYWRLRTPSNPFSNQQSGPLPLPHNQEQVIMLGDFTRFDNASDRHWRARLKKLSSRFIQVTTKPKNQALYLGHSTDFDIAKQQVTTPNVTPDAYAKKQLLALLSITPARFTLAMLRELRQKITGGSVAIEIELFSQPNLIWQRSTDNGYWASPDDKYRKAFERLPATTQQAAIEIIEKHLPPGIDSLRHEMFLLLPQLIDNSLTATYASEFAKARQSMVKISKTLLAANERPGDNTHYLNYLHKLSERLGNCALKIATEATQTLTIMYHQANLLKLDIQPPIGINSVLLSELEQQGTALPGSLIQTDLGLQVTDKASFTGRPLIELEDIGNVLISSNVADQKANLTKTSPYFPPEGCTTITGQTSQEKFTFELFKSEQLYWAKSVTIDELGMTATADGVKVYWDSDSKLTHIENLSEQSDAFLKRANVTTLPSAPEWLKKNPPQLDIYGLFTKIPLGATTITLRYIPAGNFIMGSPETEIGHRPDEVQRNVTIHNSYWLSATTISVEQYRYINEEDVSHHIVENPLPITNRTLALAEFMLLCEKLYYKTGLIAMLPNEAQWEYACRAGTTSPYWFGHNISSDRANVYFKNTFTQIKEAKTNAKYPFNPWGLNHLHGNVGELCINSKTDKLDMVLRGGSYKFGPKYSRSASRQTIDLFGDHDKTPIGLRICVASGKENLSETALEKSAYYKLALARIDFTEYGPWSLDRNSANLPTNKAEQHSDLKAPDPLDLAEHHLQNRWKLRPPKQFPSAWAKRFGYDKFGLWQLLDIAGFTLRFRYITPGHYISGSNPVKSHNDIDEKQHQDTLITGFWLAETTITQSLWQAVMGNAPSNLRVANKTRSPHDPVESVSWIDCLHFCQLLNERVPSLNASLPSEQQWEYACRADTKTAYSCGDELTPEVAHYDDIGSYSSIANLHTATPNPWGLKAMHGSVWEWCLDQYTDTINHAPDKSTVNPQQHAMRVLRGGSWLDDPKNCRTAFRYFAPQDTKANNIGLRICCNIATANKPPLTFDLSAITAKSPDKSPDKKSAKAQTLDRQIVGYQDYDFLLELEEAGQQQTIAEIIDPNTGGSRIHEFSVKELLEGFSKKEKQDSDFDYHRLTEGLKAIATIAAENSSDQYKEDADAIFARFKSALILTDNKVTDDIFGKIDGQCNIAVRNKQTDTIESIIALSVLQGLEQQDIDKHTDKLSKTFDVLNNKRNFIVTITQTSLFTLLWQRYTLVNQQLPEKFIDISKQQTNPNVLKCGITQYQDGREIYHIFVNCHFGPH